MGWQKGLLVIAGAALIALASATSALAIGLRSGSSGTGTTRLEMAPSASVAPERDTLTVVGSGTGTAAPDQARITLGVDPVRANVHDALAVGASDMNKLLGALHEQGVQDKDIQTTAIGVSTVYNCCPQGPPTYQANSQVAVLVHHLANVGSLIAAAVDAVGNDLQAQGVFLSVSDPGAAVKVARQAAMADAGARAKEWAGLAGRHLGKMLAVSELVSSPGLGSPCTGGCGSGGGGIPVAGGTSTVDLTVTVVYELLD